MKSGLPTSDLYHEAIQNPRLVFTDQQLKTGTVVKDGFGLPEVAGGGFALTYRIKTPDVGKDFAVRVFHKESNEIANRYQHISNFLNSTRSPYFVGFEFQPEGILVQGTRFPVVRMEWVEGQTLGTVIDDNVGNSGRLMQLRTDICRLGEHLAQKRIAHGDLQIDNILVAKTGLKLVDYDGMFVPGMPFRQSSELGHRNFQHPERAEQHFDHALDRFSLILLDFSIELASACPAIYRKFNTGNNIIFTTADMQSPGSSEVFRSLFADATFKISAKRFADLCQTRFEKIPTPGDYFTGIWIPTVHLKSSAQHGSSRTYIGAYPIIDGMDYASALRRIGDQVELIGQITDVRMLFKRGRGGGRYAFINFGNWKGRITKIVIWPSHLHKFSPPPDASWIGKWVSVTGLLQPPYHNEKHGYTHISIEATKQGQIHEITESDARYRLGQQPIQPSKQSNRGILDGLTRVPPLPRAPAPPRPPSGASDPSTPNQKILDGLKKTSSPSPTSQGTTPSVPQSRPISIPQPRSPSVPVPTPLPKSVKSNGSNWGCLIIVFIFLLVLFLSSKK
ncbi:serine/threonine protein kinase [Opitutaceae bacterium TAV4]|nr:serine/threonine protein kinase [Opitutaceae bacterium TAV4]RRJ99193.1 serine/threonine protein kinase [Opitutaceae bacterium TAV3]